MVKNAFWRARVINLAGQLGSLPVAGDLRYPFELYPPQGWTAFFVRRGGHGRLFFNARRWFVRVCGAGERVLQSVITRIGECRSFWRRWG
jgi:hypothetical protein